MIPPFSEAGFLPKGIHTATLSEVEERYVRVPGTLRRAQIFEKFKLLCEACRKVSFVKRILLAGSFVSAKLEPNDYDCVLVLDANVRNIDLTPSEYNLASKRAVRRIFGGDIYPLIEETQPCATMIEFFQHNKTEPAIGIVEVLP